MGNTRQRNKERNIIVGLTSLLLLTTIADIWTALSSELFMIAETNPIYVMTGSVWVLLFVSLSITAWAIWRLNKNISLFGIYFFILFTLFVIAGHCLGVYANVSAEKAYQTNPEATVAYMEQYSDIDKVRFNLNFLGVLICLPCFLSGLAFFFTEHVYESREPERLKLIEEIYDRAKKIARR